MKYCLLVEEDLLALFQAHYTQYQSRITEVGILFQAHYTQYQSRITEVGIIAS
jgi:hypothetical protein